MVYLGRFPKLVKRFEVQLYNVLDRASTGHQPGCPAAQVVTVGRVELDALSTSYSSGLQLTSEQRIYP